MNNAVSPSRTYVAICDTPNFTGHYFKKFVLPGTCKNDADTASWYFLNRLDSYSCIRGCFTFEDFSNITESK